MIKRKASLVSLPNMTTKESFSQRTKLKDAFPDPRRLLVFINRPNGNIFHPMRFCPSCQERLLLTKEKLEKLEAESLVP